MTTESNEKDWPEPQPTDGPEYHIDHAFWREAMTRYAERQQAFPPGKTSDEETE